MLEDYGHLLAAAVVFLGLHMVPARASVRDRVIGAIGRRIYLAAFSLLALAALVALTMAFNHAPFGLVLWNLGELGGVIAVVVMPIAFILLVAGVSAPNPTAATADDGPPKAGPATGALRITRHPVMWALALWAVAHLLANGELRAVILFGTFTALALMGIHSIDAKTKARNPLVFQVLEAETSRWPFAAILAGRQSLGAAVREIGWVRLAVALALYAAILHLHPWAFGVYAIPTTL
ncbi:MAG: hypothetical protein H6843_06870 [Rhodospirillaceae bacterium]|nr:hypothetical protein [Rhodospirillaceae bacterium]